MSKPAGDYDYEARGQGYATQRQPDPRIAALIDAALGPARTVLNIGAGAGSYEPADRYVLAIEPSAAMRAQRPARLVPAIHGVAGAIPLDDQSVDASMATLTVHQWPNAEQGLRELRRVTRGPIVVMTFDRELLGRFWLAEYAPELIAAERERYRPLAWIGRLLGDVHEIVPVPIPIDCTDGFTEAFYARPERLLEASVRRGQSAWGFVSGEAEARAVESLRRDLESGAWDARHGHLRTQPSFAGSLCLVVGRPA